MNALKQICPSLLASGVALVLLTSCASTQVAEEEDKHVVPAEPQEESTDPEPRNLEYELISEAGSSGGPPPSRQTFMKVGSGEFLSSGSEQPGGEVPAGEVTLNFESADVREMIKVVFEQILSENYLIDKSVKGVVTLHTTKPVARDSVLSILNSVLEMNGATVVHEEGYYKVIPISGAAGEQRAATVGRTPPKGGVGAGVQIVPLEYISARNIKKVLDTVNSDGTAVQVDESRNLVILSGSAKKIRNLLDTIEIFDVDWLEGMSFGIIPLQHTDAATLVGETSKIIGAEGEGPLAGIVQLIPIERMNSVLVITHQPKYLETAKQLVEEFDQGADTAPGRRLFVYRLKHSTAEHVASVLQEIFMQPLQPGSRPRRAAQRAPANRSNVRQPRTSPITPVETVAIARAMDENAEARSDERALEGPSGLITIIADRDNNALLIYASALDYRSVEATIRRLDIARKQVLIEATIAEVKLTDNLSYGIRWFLEGEIGNYDYKTGLGTPLPGDVAGNGFTLGILSSSGQVRALFDLLDTESTVKFLAAPQLMVLDNNVATIRVGDQIPITTRGSQNTSDADAPIITEVQYRDTGTLLTVKPQINDGGMITMEISQEVSIPGNEPAQGGGGNVPISQRTIDSTVVVHSGQTVILGGLIRETTTLSKDGIIGLQHLPLLGPLFGSTSQSEERTELFVTIRPKIVTNPQEAVGVTDELRSRMLRASFVESNMGQPEEIPERRQ